MQSRSSHICKHCTLHRRSKNCDFSNFNFGHNYSDIAEPGFSTRAPWVRARDCMQTHRRICNRFAIPHACHMALCTGTWLHVTTPPAAAITCTYIRVVGTLQLISVVLGYILLSPNRSVALQSNFCTKKESIAEENSTFYAIIIIVGRFFKIEMRKIFHKRNTLQTQDPALGTLSRILNTTIVFYS